MRDDKSNGLIDRLHGLRLTGNPAAIRMTILLQDQTSPLPVILPPAGIARRPLHEEVAERVRGWITDGTLAQGSRLNERMLCEALGVSRTPLREALKMLAAERLVELSPNRGARVVALSRHDVEELFELMGTLEGLSGELAAQRRSDAELASIEALQAQMLDAHARADLPAYYDANRRIHELINRAARNAALSETYDSINSRIQNLRFRSNFNRKKWDQAVGEHQRMLEALRERDAPALRALLEAHLRHKRDAVLEQWNPAP